jgi:hypothetical protein
MQKLSNLNNFIGKLLKTRQQWFVMSIVMVGFLISCARPQLEVTVKNFVLPNSSESIAISYSPCGIPRGKCGGGAIGASGKEGFETIFFISANPVYLTIQGTSKLQFIIRKNGKICADKIIITKKYIVNTVQNDGEYSIHCEEK